MRNAIVRLGVTAAVLALLAPVVLAQPQAPRFDTILYGASYYWEYMPAERLEKDFELMEKAGLKVMLGTPTYSIPAWLYKKHPEAAGPHRSKNSVDRRGALIIKSYFGDVS